jgi:hypothetical protein
MTTRRALVNIAGVTAEMPDGDALPYGALPVGTTANTVAAGDDSRITGAIPSSLLTTRGDVIRRGASTPQRLALGTAGHVYQSDGTDFVSGPLTAPAFPTGPGIVTPAMLDNGAAVSLLGRSANSSGARADIAAAINDRILSRTSNQLGFTQVTAGMFPTGPGVVTPAMLDNGAALSLLGRSANSSGARADITAPSDGQVMRRSGTAIGFGAVDLASVNSVSGVLPAGNLPDASTTAEGVSEFATAAEFRTGTDTARSLVVDQVWAAAALGALTDGANIAVDLALAFNFGGASNAVLGLAGNRALSAPTNLKTGQTGILWFGAVTSTRTLTLNAAWLLMDGVEVGPYSITTTQILGLCYWVRASTPYVTSILRRAA